MTVHDPSKAGSRAWVQSRCFTPTGQRSMDDETFNLSIRKFLKLVGVSSQREIEQAVARALAQQHIQGTETFAAKVTLEVAGLALKVDFDGEIRLQ